jgi:uncharacterized Zn finger protein
VSGSEIYEVEVKVLPVAKARWQSICEDCAGSIDSLVELLQGRLSKGVMERICRQQTGLFPSPKEIKLSCSCPDWAEMCKHVAAVLYGVGARLDQQPELLFRLREVDEKELIANAGKALPRAKRSPSAAKVLDGEDLSKLFGLDMAGSEAESAEPAKAARVQKTDGTKAKPVPMGAPAKPTGKTASQTKSAAKKKAAAVSAKAKPDKAARLKNSAVTPTTNSASSAKESAVSARKKKAASVAAKAKPTKTAAAKKPTGKRSSQTKSSQRNGSVRRSAKS